MGKQQEFDQMLDSEKAQMCFLLTRFMSITLPVFSARLTRVGVNGVSVVNFWQSLLSKQYKSTPKSWYVKTKRAKEETNKKQNKYTPTKEVVDIYCRMNDVDHTTFLETEKRYRDELHEELKEIERNIKKSR